MSKARDILDQIWASGKVKPIAVDLALSELRGLVMGMKKDEHDEMCGSRPEWYDKQNWGMCDCSIRTHNHAVETIANELFGVK